MKVKLFTNAAIPIFFKSGYLKQNNNIALYAKMPLRDAPEESVLAMVGSGTYYMKTLRSALSYLDAWPHAALDSKKPVKFFRSKLMCVINWMLILASTISYMIRNHAVLEFDGQMHCLMGIFIVCIMVQRGLMIAMKPFAAITSRFVRDIHLVYFKDKNEYSKEIYNKVERILTLYTDGGLFLVVAATLIFNSSGVIFNLKQGLYSSQSNGTLLQAVYIDLPFDYTSSFNAGYLVVFIVLFSFVLDTGLIMVFTDILLISIFIHLWGHLKILRNMLETSPKPQMGETKAVVSCPWFNEKENETITTRLKECIEYHKFISTSISDVSDVYGATLCFFHFFYILCGCVLLVQCTISDSSKIIQSIPILLSINLQLIQVSFLFEFLRTECEMLKYATYALPWESMNQKNRKIILFYLMKLQEPMIPNALGLLAVGVETMAALMKTTVSYYMILCTLGE